MKSYVIKALVRFPKGTYWQENGWTETEPDFDAHMHQVLAESLAVAKTLGGKGGPLSATFSRSIDGVAQPDVIVNGVSYDGLIAFEKHAHKAQGDIIHLGEKHAATKK